MKGNYDHVFSPYSIKGVEFRNRIFTPPTLAFMATADGMATREMIEYYRSFARGGVAVVTVGDSAVNFAYGKNHESQLNLGTDEVISSLHDVLEGITRHGAVASIELNHGGHNTFVRGGTCYGASAIPSGNEELQAELEGRLPVEVKEMTQGQIGEVIEDYAKAAQRCMMAGFKMIMVHNAHGHLLAQFLSPLSNKRHDRWGGSLQNRARFPLAVLDAIRKKCGSELIIEYRISADEKYPGGMEPKEVIEFLKMAEDKIDIVHVSAGLLSIPGHGAYMMQPYYMPHMYNVHYAAEVKKNLHIPVTTVGSIMNLDNAEKIISEGVADFVAIARPLIADQDLLRKSAFGRQETIRPCVRCNVCTGPTGIGGLPYGVRCGVNPIAGRGVEYPTEDAIPPARRRKKVLVVGGGPAGMQAAWTAVTRGHEVLLYEMKDRLGGMLEYAASLPFKQDMRSFLAWLIARTESSGAVIRYNTEVNADIVTQEKPDALVLAVGATPVTPDIPGINLSHVHWVGNLDAGNVDVGERVIVVGAGLMGVEAAFALTQQNKHVTIIEMQGMDSVLKDVPFVSGSYLKMWLNEEKDRIMPNVKIEAITESGVRVTDQSFTWRDLQADTVILAVGMKRREEKVDELRRLIPETEVSIIGDCYQPRNLANAIHNGFNCAVDL